MKNKENRTIEQMLQSIEALTATKEEKIIKKVEQNIQIIEELYKTNMKKITQSGITALTLTTIAQTVVNTPTSTPLLSSKSTWIELILLWFILYNILLNMEALDILKNQKNTEHNYNVRIQQLNELKMELLKINSIKQTDKTKIRTKAKNKYFS